MLIMGALYLTGALLYATRIPERFLPGKCDIWFQSHQVRYILLLKSYCKTNSKQSKDLFISLFMECVKKFHFYSKKKHVNNFYKFLDLPLVGRRCCICPLSRDNRDGSQSSSPRNQLRFRFGQCVRMTNGLSSATSWSHSIQPSGASSVIQFFGFYPSKLKCDTAFIINIIISSTVIKIWSEISHHRFQARAHTHPHIFFFPKILHFKTLGFFDATSPTRYEYIFYLKNVHRSELKRFGTSVGLLKFRVFDYDEKSYSHKRSKFSTFKNFYWISDVTSTQDHTDVRLRRRICISIPVS